MSKATWEHPVSGANNVILDGDDFYISYNKVAGAPNPAVDNSGIGDIAQLLGGVLTGESRPQEETALYDQETGSWYILKGDFRKEYEKAYPGGLKACLEVYQRNIKHRSNWSTDDVQSE